MSDAPGRKLIAIEPGERPFVGAMFGYFFLTIVVFWILKPIKKALFLGYYDELGMHLAGSHLDAAQVELVAKLLNIAVAAGAVALFAWLSQRLVRERLAVAVCALCATGLSALALGLKSPGAGTVWSLYLFGDLFSTLMVPTFFAFLNDSVSPDAAKRLYGPIGLGGVLGGTFGSTTTRGLIGQLDDSALVWICVGLVVGIALLAIAAGRMSPRRELVSDEAEAEEPRKPSLLEGVALTRRSSYLLAIVALVGLYEIVSTIVDFQFSATVAHLLEGEAIRSHVASTYAITNWVAFGVQLLATSWVMRKLGVGAALLVLPLAIALGATGFLVVPSLWLASAMAVSDNGLNYSINQSAREALWVPTSPVEKYQAKAVIDMFVQRFAKGLAIGLSLAITLFFEDPGTVRWLSIGSLVVLAVWIGAARHAGRRFEMASA